MLERLAPEGVAVDVHPYFIHARVLAGMFGLVALLAFAATVWRSSPLAAFIAVALILATARLWWRGFGEIRAEPFALAFFWVGTWLVMSRRGWKSGVGIGLVAISCLWQPKWPVVCAVVGLFWLVRDRRFQSIAAAGITVAFGFLAIRMIVPLDLWWFFNFDVNAALAQGVAASEWARSAHFKGGVPFLFVPDAFHPLWAVPAVLLLAASAWIERSTDRLLPVALFIAAWIEIRFVYPWPLIWIHYYMMWGMASAAALALVPSSVRALLQRSNVPPRAVRLVTVGLYVSAFVLTLPHVVAVAPTTADHSTYWVSQQYLRERLGADDEVWLEPTRHPVSVRDAHYYWFCVAQMLDAAEELRKTEKGRRYLPATAPSPPCSPQPNLRFTMHPEWLPETARCMERLRRSGEVVRTPFFGVWEVRLKSPATQPD